MVLKKRTQELRTVGFSAQCADQSNLRLLALKYLDIRSQAYRII